MTLLQRAHLRGFDDVVLQYLVSKNLNLITCTPIYIYICLRRKFYPFYQLIHLIIGYASLPIGALFVLKSFEISDRPRHHAPQYRIVKAYWDPLNYKMLLIVSQTICTPQRRSYKLSEGIICRYQSSLARMCELTKKFNISLNPEVRIRGGLSIRLACSSLSFLPSTLSPSIIPCDTFKTSICLTHPLSSTSSPFPQI